MSDIAQELINEIDISLREICKKKGLLYESSEIKIKDGLISLKSNMSLIKNGITIYEAEYLENCEKLGLKKEWLHINIIKNNSAYRIGGYYKKRTKKPIKVLNINSDQELFFHPDEIRLMWS